MFFRKMFGWLGITLISIQQVQGARVVDGSVIPETLSANDTNVTIGSGAWGAVKVDDGSQWSVDGSWFHVENGGAFNVTASGTLVDVQLISTSLINILDGSMSVTDDATVKCNKGVRLGWPGLGLGSLTIANATAEVEYCDVRNGSAVIKEGGQLDGTADVCALPFGQPINTLTVEGAGSVMTGSVRMYGGTLTVRDGGQVLGGGDLYSNSQNDDEPMVTRGYVSGAGAVWGNTNNILHVIGEGGEVYVSDGGAVKSAGITVGENHSSALDQLALLDVTGPGSSVAVHPFSGMTSGYLKIGYYSPAQVNVRDGALLQVPSVTVRSNGVLRVDGLSAAGTFPQEQWTTLTNTSIVSEAGSQVLISGDTTLIDVAQLYANGGAWQVDGATLMTRTSATISEGSRVDMSDATWICKPYLMLGYQGAGSLSLSDGATFTGADVYLGRYAAAVGDLSVSGAGTSWTSAGDLRIGVSGKGTIHVASGAAVQAEDCLVGENAGSTGRLLLSGSNTVVECDVLNVGMKGSGRVEILDGATLTSAVPVFAGDVASATLTVAGADSLFSSTNSVRFGAVNGSFDVAVTNGGSMVTGGVVLKSTVPDMRQAVVSGENSLWNSDGYFSIQNAHLSIEDGGRLAANELQVGYPSALDVRAARCEVAELLDVYGDLTICDGAVMTSGSASLELQEESTQRLSGAGTVWTNAGAWQVMSYVESGGPAFMIEDGAMLWTETAIIGSQWGYGDLTVDGADSVLQVTGVLNVGWNPQMEEYGYDEGGEGGEGGDGEGSYVMHHLTLNEGQISGGTVAINQSGEISGQGRISGATSNEGSLAPGTESSCGKLHFTGAYTQLDSGVLSVDLRSAPVNGAYDQIDAADHVTLAGTLRVNISDWAPIGTNDFQIIESKESIQGTFSQIEVTGISADAVEYLGNGVVRVVGATQPYDDYLATYGLSPTDPDCGLDEDYDHDGFSNYDEFIAGTNLKVSNAYLLKVLDFSLPVTGPCSLSFDAVAGRNYPVYLSTNLCAVEPWVLSQVITNTVSGVRTITLPSEGGFRCYRLGVTRP